MLKYFIVFSLFIEILLSDETKISEKVEFFAGKFETLDGVVYARDGVMVLYNGEYLSAKELKYDFHKKLLVLNGSITLLQGDSFRVIGEHLLLDLKNDKKELSPLFLLEQKAGVWMSAANAVVKKEQYHLQSGMISGCDPQDPLWKIYFSSAEYNQKTKWIQLYNTRLHLYNIPILYVPYFAYPTDTTRHSGLLLPSLGYSADEGFFYEQPIFVAPYDSWDIELKPQVRTNRGEGLYSTFRFRDSKVSKGSIGLGFFREHDSYVAAKSLANKRHFGAEFLYDNVNWLDDWFGFESDAQSEFYADVKWMNDVDYLNLSSSIQGADTSISEYSVANLFYNLEQNYFGAYFKYFLDLRSQSNTKTIQTLPSLQYHHYLENFFNKHLLVNNDIRVKNYFRENGINAKEITFTTPLLLQTSLFDDYLNLSYELNNNIKVIKLHQDGVLIQASESYSKGLNYQMKNVLTLSSSLNKDFKNLTHTIYLSAEYVSSENIYTRNYYTKVDKSCVSDLLFTSQGYCDYDRREINEERAGLTFKQFLFDKETQEQILYHKLQQKFSLNLKNQVQKELENEFEIRYFKYLSFYSDTLFEYERNTISQTYNRVSYHSESIDFSVGNFYASKLNQNKSAEYEKYYIFHGEYRYNKHYKYFSRYLYDFEHHLKKSAEIGFFHTKRCWSFGLRYLENLRPILSDDGKANSIDEHFIFATIELKPFGGSEFNYKIENTLQGN